MGGQFQTLGARVSRKISFKTFTASGSLQVHFAPPCIGFGKEICASAIVRAMADRGKGGMAGRAVVWIGRGNRRFKSYGRVKLPLA